MRYGEQFGPVITGKERNEEREEGGRGPGATRSGAQHGEPYNLGGTAPCLLV